MENGSFDRAMRRALEERNCKALQMLIRSGATPVIPRQCETMPFQLRGDTCVAKARIPTV